MTRCSPWIGSRRSTAGATTRSWNASARWTTATRRSASSTRSSVGPLRGADGLHQRDLPVRVPARRTDRVLPRPTAVANRTSDRDERGVLRLGRAGPRGADPGDRALHILVLSLIHISEPTRRTPISYAV